jgi:hypothetical protein
VGDVESDPRGINKKRSERCAEELADVVLAEKERLRPFGNILERLCGVRRYPSGLPRPVPSSMDRA